MPAWLPAPTKGNMNTHGPKKTRGIVMDVELLKWCSEAGSDKESGVILNMLSISLLTAYSVLIQKLLCNCVAKTNFTSTVTTVAFYLPATGSINGVLLPDGMMALVMSERWKERVL